MGTAALVNNFCPAHLDGTRLIIGGIFAELRNRLIMRRALYSAADDASSIGEFYDPEIFAEEMNVMLKQAEVHCLYGENVEEVKFGKNDVRFLLRQGRTLHARAVVDATGDAALAAKGGTSFQFGRARDGAVMPLTFCFSMGPVNLAALHSELPDCLRYDERTGENYCHIISHPEIDRRMLAARARGELDIPLDRVPGVVSIPGRPEIVTVNFDRVACQYPTDQVQLARASEEGRRQIEQGAAFFRAAIPGFTNTQVIEIARQIGVRQSRQIDGLYELTTEDCVSCRQFEDVIAQCSYSLDMHEPESDAITLIRFEPGTHYDIPWRCLIPRNGPENLVVAGRCISASAGAMSSLRVSPSAMAIGEAAGVTASLAVRDSIPGKTVNWREVQAALNQHGAILN